MKKALFIVLLLPLLLAFAGPAQAHGGFWRPQVVISLPPVWLALPLVVAPAPVVKHPPGCRWAPPPRAYVPRRPPRHHHRNYWRSYGCRP